MSGFCFHNLLQFYQPTGVCVEFDHVVYVCDSQTNCIKMLTTLKKTADFLNAIGKIYKAFSVHEKHQPYKLCTLLEAAALVDQCLVHLRQNEALIRNKVLNLPHSLNGPQGNVA